MTIAISLILVVLSAGAISLGPFLLQNQVTVRIAILDKFDGAFGKNCVPTDYVSGTVPDKVRIAAALDSKESQSKIPSYFPDSEGKCAGFVTLNLSRGKDYEVFSNDNLIGLIQAKAIDSGEATVTVPVEVKHDLTVRFDLTGKADSCSGSKGDWSCSWNNDYSFPLKLNQSEGSCAGKGPYYDIQDSASVVVTGLTNHLKFSTNLVVDTYDLPSLKSKRIVCKFHTFISGLPHDPQGYGINVGKGHGTVDFRTEDLEATGWEADLIIDG